MTVQIYVNGVEIDRSELKKYVIDNRIVYKIIATALKRESEEEKRI